LKKCAQAQSRRRQSQERSMYLDDPRPQIGYRGNAISRAKDFALKVAIIADGALTLASAFVVSLLFLALGWPSW
jgi:hypothetical protein